MIQFSQDGLNLPHFVWEAIQICSNQQHLDVRLKDSGLLQTQNDAPDNFNALTNSKPFVNFEVLANSKSRPGQIQGFDNFETMHQTNLGHRQIGNDDPDKFGAWKCGGDGRVGELVPRHGIGENWIEAGLSISPLSYIWNFSPF